MLRSLILSDVRRVADGLDIALAQGALNTDDIAAMANDTSALRGKLGEVGVALGKMHGDGCAKIKQP